MKSILDVEVSCYANYKETSEPRNVNLLRWLSSKKYREKVECIRQLSDKYERDMLKATLPAITPCGVFSYREEKSLLQHSGFIQFDIDLKDNQHILNYAQLKEELKKIINVAYCGLSVSGTGFWGLVPIAYPEKHKQQFAALVRLFAQLGIQIDTAPANVSSLRGYSYDPNAYFNHHAIPLQHCYAPSRPTFKSIKSDNSRDGSVVVACIQEIEQKKVDVTAGYQTWCGIGFSLASTFGEEGREYFHRVSQFHPEYDPVQADKQYTSCLRANGDIGLGTFIHHCRLAGIKATVNKKVISLKQPQYQTETRVLPDIPQPKVRVSKSAAAVPPVCKAPSPAVRSGKVVGVELSAEKKIEIEELVRFFNDTDLPNCPVRLDAGNTIIDVEQFVESHIQVVSSAQHKWKYRQPYFERLQRLRSLLSCSVAA